MPADIVAKVGRRLAEHAGLELPAWILSSRIEARLAALAMDPQAYLGLVNAPHGRGELHALVEAVRVGETRFFRHAAQVQALTDVVVPAWRARGKKIFRAWSAGCATGEEPYTLALILSRLVPRLSILATDVSEDALAVARAGRYPDSILANVPTDWHDAFTVHGGHARVKPELASLVSFERHNLTDDEAPRGFDLVWCRNVLIYFSAPARAHAVEHLLAACDQGGFVFVGYSESLRDTPGLEAIRANDCVIYERVDPARQRRITPISIPVPLPVPGSKSEPTRSPTPTPTPTPPTTTTVSVTDPELLSGEVTKALARPGIEKLTIDLDRAPFLTDEVAPVLRRARAAAEASGIALAIIATKPGAQRWLRRHKLEGVP
ncbi:MAG TPA: protein-glutamate O-methyltransferase CheR [Kofleriaceae bacterium]|nr:protein-glutamate O-methyltransferase CheR [Kofleriaceae bacterium]